MSIPLRPVLCVVCVALLWTTGCGKPSPTGPREAAAPPKDTPQPTDVDAPPTVDAPSTEAADTAPPYWPRFHGPAGDNISADTGLLTRWPEAGPELVWTAEGLGDGYAGITTAAGRIYTAGNVDDQTTIVALDLDGNQLWKTPNGEPWTGSYEGVRGTPTVDGERLYHLSPLGRLACFDAATGEEIWSRSVLEEFGAKNLKWALAESVLIDGPRVICTPGGPQVSVVAFDKTNGQTVWKAESTGHATGYASPVVAEHQGLRMILTMDAESVFGVDAESGRLLWQAKHETRYNVNVLTPIHHEGRVFVSSGYGAGSQMFQLRVAGENISAERVWESDDMDNHHGGVILRDGYLYGAASEANGAKWICLDWKTGRMMYAEKGVGKGSLTLADGLLYTLSEKNAMGLVEPTPDGHTLISRFKVPSGGGGPSWAHPVVVGGRLYIRHADTLFAYNVRGS